ncbi:MAG: rod shape-determining protein RodA [Rickettsiales bacterium]
MLEGLKNKYLHLPKAVLVLITLLSFFGLIIMFVAGGGSIFPYAFKQGIFFVVFYIIMLMTIFVDLKYIYSFSYFFYFVSLVLLILVEVVGHKAMGATRWINLGFFKMQPSELMKISLVLALAKYFHTLGEERLRFRSLLTPIFLILLPSLVIMKQPDLGTGIIIIMVGGVVLFLAGTQPWKFAFAALSVCLIAPILWTKLHAYQKKRVEIFLNPELDPLGSGYNIIQSKIAIGSGGLFGKGFLEGTQAQLEFLPEHQTDFVFPMFAEEFGFIGSMFLLSVYFMLMIFGIKVANHSKTLFGRYSVYGLISIFIFHVLINMGMVMGLLPVVGIPLPFMSYGGTILGATFLIFGIIINVHVSKKIVLPQSSVKYLF